MKERKQGWMNNVTRVSFMAAAALCGTAGAEPAGNWQSVVSETPQIQTSCDGVQVSRFGFCWVLKQSPDFLPDRTLQQGNAAPRRKIPIKASGELTKNYIGLCTTRMPHTPERAYHPLESAHLIDGDLQTCWMSRQQTRSNEQPMWIRLDFPLEQNVTRLVLKKRPLTPRPRAHLGWCKTVDAVEVGRGIPRALSVKISKTAAEWQTVYSGDTGDTPEKEEWAFSFPAGTRAKQVWVSSSELVMVENMLYSFSIAEMEVYNDKNENIAKLSRGTGVTVNSTYHAMGNQDLAERRWYWPLHADTGAKWVRIGYHDDPINWHWVEQKKGVLEIDPVADAAITELVTNGLTVVMALNFGNRLYCGPEGRECPQLWAWNYDMPKPPTTPEALAAWKRYVTFMVDHFKDRVQHFEIWNEWNISCYWGDAPNLQHFLAISDIAISVIREHAPKAKIMMGSLAGFPHGMKNWDAATLEKNMAGDIKLQALKALAPKVDEIGWHPFYNMKAEKLYHYAEDVGALKHWLAGQGFHGRCMATEWNCSALYPYPLEKDLRNVWCGHYNSTEMTKAKLIARVFTTHAALDVPAFFCELYSSDALAIDLSLMRDSFHADPIAPIQPQAAYYVTRTLASLMDGWTPAEFPAAAPEGVAKFTFATPRGKGIALWQNIDLKDDGEGKPVTLAVEGSFSSATAFDPINGVSQELQVSAANGKTEIRQLLVGDAPLFAEMRP